MIISKGKSENRNRELDSRKPGTALSTNRFTMTDLIDSILEEGNFVCEKYFEWLQAVTVYRCIEKNLRGTIRCRLSSKS